MITAGIDMGAKNIKTVILQEGRILAKAQVRGGFDAKESALQCFQSALDQAGLSLDKIDRIFSSGSGRKDAPYQQGSITEVSAASKAASHFYPNARTVIDVGAEEGRAIRCDESGKVVDFAINEKCAAGAGAFTESMARALEVPLEEFGPLSLKSNTAIPMNAQCAVFAESEVVSLVHAGTSKENIARAVHDAIASRIVSLVRKVGYTPEVVVVGGVANNIGFVEALNRGLETKTIVAENPEFMVALGAALAASE
ncbi:MAG: acyl-CoA dehydratase activase [bacterium]